MELKGKIILVVEDNKTINRQLTLILSKHGALVIQAKDGLEAVGKAQNDKPDVILMDLLMPVMDGLTAIKSLRADPSTKEIPVIMLTGSKNSDDRDQCLAYGANSYVTKPAPGQKVVEAIKDVL